MKMQKHDRRPAYEKKVATAKKEAHELGYVLILELTQRYDTDRSSIYYWVRKEETKKFNGMIAVKETEKLIAGLEKSVANKGTRKLTPQLKRKLKKAEESPYFSYDWMFSGDGNIFKTENWVIDHNKK